MCENNSYLVEFFPFHSQDQKLSVFDIGFYFLKVNRTVKDVALTVLKLCSSAFDFYTVPVPLPLCFFVHCFGRLASTVPYRFLFKMAKPRTEPSKTEFYAHILLKTVNRTVRRLLTSFFITFEALTVPIKLSVYRFLLEKRLRYRITTENG